MCRQTFTLFLCWELTIIYLVASQKINPNLQAKIENGGTANILISFGSTTPTLQATKAQRSSGTPSDKANIVRNSLIQLANNDQASFINMLQTQRTGSSPINFQTLWISNRIYIKDANFELVKQIANNPNVNEITEEAIFTIDDTVSEPVDTTGPDDGPVDYTYGLKRIQAPEAWQVLGGPEKAGEGVVVGVADSGCNLEHEALKDNYIGGDYGYYNPYQGEDDAEGQLLHGTHVTGTILGKKGIGVAPAAKHVQCQMCFGWNCTELGFDKCLQFFICPFKADGSDPDCSKRVHIINMSLENLPYSAVKALEAARAAGIILVSAAGNSGPICRTISLPGISDEVITTGATDKDDQLAMFSSLGSDFLRPEDVFKPDVVGPGVDVLSANYDTSKFKYLLMNGTSMATPHLAGLVALLLTRDKTLTLEQVKEIISKNTDHTVRLSDPVWCDGNSIPKGSIPNSLFGYGRFNALKAINAQTAILAEKK